MPNKITLSPKKILLTLLVIALVQVIAYLLVAYLKPDSMYVAGFWDLLNIDQEMSIPTWYSQFLFLIPALIMAWLSFTSEGRKYRWYWGVLSIIMVYLSLDDGAMIHERFWIITRYFGLGGVTEALSLNGVFYYPWLIIAIVLVLLVCAFFAKFFFNLPIRTRWLMVLSGTTFLAGAIGVEMYTGYVIDSTGRGVAPIVIAIEETLEILGVSLLIYTLLDYIRSLSPKSRRAVTIEVAS